MKINNKINFTVVILFSSLISACGGSGESSVTSGNGVDDKNNLIENDDNLIPRQEIIINGNDSSVSYKGRNLINAVSAGSDKEDDLYFEIEFPENNNDGLIEIIDNNNGTFKINAPKSKVGSVIDFDLKITNKDRIDDKTGMPEVDIRNLKLIIKDDQNSGNFSYKLHNNSSIVDLNLDGYKYYTSNDARNYILPINYRVHLSRDDIDKACQGVLENGIFSIEDSEENSFTCFFFKPLSEEVDVFNREFAGDVISLYFYKENIENTVLYYDSNNNKIIYKSLLEDFYDIPEYYKQTEPAVNNKKLFEKNGEIELPFVLGEESKKINTVFTNKGLIIKDNNIYLVNTISEDIEKIEIEKEENSNLEWINQSNTSSSFVILEKGEKNKVWEIKRNFESNILIDNVGDIVENNIIKIKNNIISMIMESNLNKIKVNNKTISDISFSNNNGFINDNYGDIYVPIIKNEEEKIYKVVNESLEDIGVNINQMENKVYSIGYGNVPYLVHNEIMSYKNINYNNGGYYIKGGTIYLSLHENNNINHEEIYNINESNNISRFISDKIDSGNSSISSMIFKVKDISYAESVVFSYKDGELNKASFLKDEILNKDIDKIIKVKGNNVNLISKEGGDFYQVCSSNNGFIESNNNIDQYIEGNIKDVSIIDEKIYLIDNNKVKIFDINLNNCN